MKRPSPTTTNLADLRTQRHAPWLRELRLSLQELVEPSLERPDQIYLFGSRARRDGDALLDTALIVVAANKHRADTWVDQVLDSGLAEDVIGLDREAWAQLPKSNSVVWRNAAKVAIPLLAERP